MQVTMTLTEDPQPAARVLIASLHGDGGQRYGEVWLAESRRHAGYFTAYTKRAGIAPTREYRAGAQTFTSAVQSARELLGTIAQDKLLNRWPYDQAWRWE